MSPNTCSLSVRTKHSATSPLRRRSVQVGGNGCGLQPKLWLAIRVPPTCLQGEVAEGRRGVHYAGS